MRPELILPVLLLLLLLAVVLLRRERAKKASPVAADPSPKAPAVSASANTEALFTIQVWELGVVVFGLLLLVAHVLTGALPLFGGLAVVLTGALAVVLRTRRSARG